ncbi:MAG: plasmid encoded RepA protein [Deltaproteobacteria bacterium]|nr:plasmid encoded RepA protein [Deltaproteobacteria bacterium]
MADLLKKVKLPENHAPVSVVRAPDLTLPDNNGPSSLSSINKRLVRSSFEISMEEPGSITYQHSILCQTGLPYRNPGDEIRKWERKQGRATLLIEAGRILNPKTQDFVKVGLPFGPKPRLILAHLNSEALKKSSSVIDVGNSLTSFVRRMGLDTCGKDIKAIKNHLSRLSCSTVRLGFVENNHALQINTQIVSAFDLWFEKDERQRVFWPSTIKLSEEYFNSLMTHAVPLDERAVASLSHSAMALDIYAWLSQRLHRISPKKPQFITWVAVKEQFGWHYGRMNNFKSAFRKTLATVLTQYKNAKLYQNDKGLTLCHSPAPVKSRLSLVSPHKKLK